MKRQDWCEHFEPNQRQRVQTSQSVDRRGVNSETNSEAKLRSDWGRHSDGGEVGSMQGLSLKYSDRLSPSRKNNLRPKTKTTTPLSAIRAPVGPPGAAGPRAREASAGTRRRPGGGQRGRGARISNQCAFSQTPPCPPEDKENHHG